MESVQAMFKAFAVLALIAVVVCAILAVLYFRWRASGQERGI